MKLKFNFSLILFLSFIYSSLSEGDEKDIRTFVNLMDYIGSDYRNAVSDGQVINEAEFLEMNEFIKRSIVVFSDINKSHKINKSDEINAGLLKLQEMITTKQHRDSIFIFANYIKSEILKLNLISISPRQIPNIQKGKVIFRKNCASCHGNSGDGNGELIKNLNPPASNFLDQSLMYNISPLQIYNTIRLGIAGTAMMPFNLLSDEEVWNAAFYVSSLRYENKVSKDEAEKYQSEYSEIISLHDISTLPDRLLINKIENNEKEKVLASFRSFTKKNEISIKSAVKLLNETEKFYSDKQYDKAAETALNAYLEYIEPFEAQLQSIKSKLKNEIEVVMFRIRSNIEKKMQLSVISSDIDEAKKLIYKADSELESTQYTFWFTFFIAATIILREGLEAFLIIVSVLSVLKSINESNAKKWVHAGWVSALFTGILGVFFIDFITSLGAKNRELMEALGSLIAVVILLYLGFWLHSKTSAQKWKEFIEDKVKKLISAKNLFGLALLSFIVVFREAFESVIFLSAINLDSMPDTRMGLYFGASISLIFVLILSNFGMKYASKLPIRKLFKYSAFVMIVLAVILAGKGVRAFQESGFSSISSIEWLEHLDFSIIGLFPTLETLSIQAAIILVSVFLWFYTKNTQSKLSLDKKI